MDEQKQQPVWQQSEQTPDTPPAKDKSKFATAGFVLGLCGLIAWLIPILGVPDGIVGIVMSIKGLKSSKRTFAIIGLVLSILCIIAAVIIFAYNLSQVPQVLKNYHLK